MQAIQAVKEADLASLRRVVEQRLAGSVDDGKLATRGSRQLFFDCFLENKVLSSDADQTELDQLLACYMVVILDGDNLTGKKIRVGTAKEYLKEALVCLSRRGLTYVPNYKDNSEVSRILRGYEKSQHVPARRAALEPRFIFAIVVDATRGKEFFGIECAIADWTAIGRNVGLRKSEFAQDKDDEVQIFVTVDGQSIVRALCGRDVTFHDACRGVIEQFWTSAYDATDHTKTIFKRQKNNDNYQEICWPRSQDPARSRWCVTENFRRVKQRARQLRQPDNLPLAVYHDPEENKVKYVTGDRYTEYIRSIVRENFPTIPEEDIKLLSTHSLRVTACTLLHEAGKDGTYIKLRLRWKSNCFEIYLRNTTTITRQHAEALELADNVLAEMALNEATFDESSWTQLEQEDDEADDDDE